MFNGLFRVGLIDYLGWVEVFECKKPPISFVYYLFRSICQYFLVYCVARVQKQMFIYIRFLSREMFSPSYFRISFCISYIKFITWASTLINNVCFVDNGVFQHKERSNLSCFPKTPNFYFIVNKRIASNFM